MKPWLTRVTTVLGMMMAAMPVWTNGASEASSLEGTVLKRVADGLEPGEWHVFSGETAIALPEGFDSFSAAYRYRGTGGGTSEDQWGPVHDWHPGLMRSFCITDRTRGTHDRDRVAFGGYDAVSHAWRIYALPEKSAAQEDRYFGRPHVYSSWTLARDKNRFYRPLGSQLHRYDPESDTWDYIQIDGPVGAGIAYLEGTSEIISIDEDGQVLALNVETGQTRSVGKFEGYEGDRTHTHGDYNSVRNEVMLLSNSRQFCIVNANGIVQTGTMPEEARGRGATWSYEAMFWDPISGHYLVANRGGGTLWEYDPDSDRWAKVFDRRETDFPWARYNGFSVAVVPELNVILWFDRSTQRVYKHKAVLGQARNTP